MTDSFVANPNGTINVNGQTGLPLQYAATLLSQDLGYGSQFAVTGDNATAQQLVSLAGANLNAQGEVTSGDPSFLQNLGDSMPSSNGISYEQLQAAAKNVGAIASGQASPSSSFSSWIESHTANYSLILFGAVIAVAALIYSQRENITTVVKTAGKAAALAA